MKEHKRDKDKIRRIYLSDESYWRLKIFASRYKVKQQEAIDSLIFNAIDENGGLFDTKVSLDKDTANIVTTLSTKFHIPPNELIKWMCETIKVLFDSKLSFHEAIRPISELKKKLKEEMPHPKNQIDDSPSS